MKDKTKERNNEFFGYYYQEINEDLIIDLSLQDLFIIIKMVSVGLFLTALFLGFPPTVWAKTKKKELFIDTFIISETEKNVVGKAPFVYLPEIIQTVKIGEKSNFILNGTSNVRLNGTRENFLEFNSLPYRTKLKAYTLNRGGAIEPFTQVFWLLNEINRLFRDYAHSKNISPIHPNNMFLKLATGMGFLIYLFSKDKTKIVLNELNEKFFLKKITLLDRVKKFGKDYGLIVGLIVSLTLLYYLLLFSPNSDKYIYLKIIQELKEQFGDVLKRSDKEKLFWQKRIDTLLAVHEHFKEKYYKVLGKNERLTFNSQTYQNQLKSCVSDLINEKGNTEKVFTLGRDQGIKTIMEQMTGNDDDNSEKVLKIGQKLLDTPVKIDLNKVKEKVESFYFTELKQDNKQDKFSFFSFLKNLLF